VAADQIKELLLGMVSFLLTVMILSYLLGDNPAFRIAVYLFIGVSAGYAGAVAWHQVIYPRLILPILSGSVLERGLAVFPLLGGVLLLMKISPRTARLGNLPLAFLVGVGAAVAVGGSILGTIFPQAQAAMGAFSASRLANNRLKYLSEGPRRLRLVRILGRVGQVFVAITLGVIFAGVFTAAMTAWIERMNSILVFFKGLRGF
jgi:hypothetical protein